MSAPIFLIPTPSLGRIEDVHPERLRASDNDWIGHTREVLRKKQQALRAGAWRPPPIEYVGDDHAKVKPHTADHCPAMDDLLSVGWMLKWPATAILRQVAPKGWQLKPSTNYDFYRYTPLTSFPEVGEAEAVLIETGWTVVTPPGWSVLIKAVPNQFVGSAQGLALAEGVVRTDMATIPLFTHAFVRPDAPKEITIKRGTPMAAIFPFQRADTELVVIDDVETVDEVAKRARLEHESYAQGAGVYRKLTMGPEPRENELFPALFEKWSASKK